MTSSFDRDIESYREAVNTSIGWSGADVEFAARLKADDLVAMLARLLRSPGEARVLDVGCGPGLTDALLVGRVGELHGVDVSQPLLDAAAKANPSVRYHRSDGVTLPLDDGFVDASFAICVLHHVEPGRRAAFVGEMVRVTRSGGLVAVYEHNPFNPITRLAVSRCEFDEGVQLLRPAEVKRRLGGAGAPIVESRSIGFFPWGGDAFRHIERRLAWLPAGAQFVVAGRVP